jgi:peptidoglycan/xylan/chitin deacetylase (PgdA/CDA1 family)
MLTRSFFPLLLNYGFTGTFFVLATPAHLEAPGYLTWAQIEEMAKIRRIRLNGITYRTEVLRVPMDTYGCVVCALVYLE